MGAFVGSIFPSERLAAAIPKRTFAPHTWHFVAVVPTSVPHEGHMRGRALDESLPKNPVMALRTRSILHCHRSGIGTQSPFGHGFLASFCSACL
jgi:hypothetical protein